MTKYSIIIPTNRNINQRIWLLDCIACQTHKPELVIIVNDASVDKDYLIEIKRRITRQLWYIPFLFVNHHEHKTFQIGKWASYLRNYWCQFVSTPLLCFIDDDNLIWKLFFATLTKRYEEIGKKYFLVPKEILKRTNTIRSMWYIGLWLITCRPIPNTVGYDWMIAFSSSNCLFWPTSVAQEIRFPEHIPFVYEDFYWTNLVAKKYWLMYISTVDVFHCMREKTKMEDIYISTPELAYQKARNRILFIKSFLTWYKKWLALIVWVVLHTKYLSILVFLYMPRDKWKDIIFAIIRWTLDWYLGK